MSWTRPKPNTCDKSIQAMCTLVGVPLDQHDPACGLRDFERDESFGSEYDCSEEGE